MPYFRLGNSKAAVHVAVDLQSVLDTVKNSQNRKKRHTQRGGTGKRELLATGKGQLKTQVHE